MYYESGVPVKNTSKNMGGENYRFNKNGVTLDFPKKKAVTYTVKADDSFWRITHNYTVSMYTPAEINGKTIYSITHPGDMLTIPQ